MSTEATPAATSDLLLKVTPPRVPRHLIARASLAWQHPRFQGSPVVHVQAPAGFGKTSLLAQWRRECLAEGAAVAWVSAQSQDDMARFVQSLALAVRIGAGRPTFGYVLLQAAPRDGLEAATLWLAELAQSALDVVLFVDEAERLPADAREALTYVLRNAPPNLRCVVAARPDSPLELDDLVAYGQCTTVAAEHLRFGLQETTALVRARMGEAFDRDEAARLHEMTEGWPLGLQLTLSVMDSGAGGLRAELPRLDLHGGALREHFVGYLLANLAPPDVEFLTCVAVAAPLHPKLCAALLADGEAEAQLARLQRDTPVFVAGEQTEWVRMHSLARAAMLRRFETLPAARQAELHGRAAEWLAGRGLLEAAARHALASGQPRLAYDMAERSLYEALMSQGRQGAVLEWLGWLPAEELDARPRLLLAATWSLALSEHHEEAERFVSRILAQPAVDDSLRCECAMILGGAAIFADDPDRFAELHDPWAEAPPLVDSKLLQVHANRTAFRALIGGEPALARLRQLQAPRGGGSSGSVYLQRWGDFHVAHAYLWEGQVMLAEKLLRPALAAADADLGRRSLFSAMLATLLAAALWERDLPEEAEAALANRLDVVERSGTADSVLLAYRTLARIAVARNSESRALELLGAMDAVGIARRLPRLRIASLTEAVRLHARRFRAETCRDLCRQIDALLQGPSAHPGLLWQQSVRVLQATAHGYAAIATQDWRGALEPLARADALAQQARLGRLHIELLALRAFALDRCGEKSRPLLTEALDLAQSGGLLRVFDDAHPALGEWVRDASGAGQARAPGLAVAAEPAREPSRLRAAPSLVLTPKEREVLELLARNLSNKEIGLAMQVGEETIKWHMKNLFAKLDAGTRKQVVSRARILGLLADA